MSAEIHTPEESAQGQGIKEPCSPELNPPEPATVWVDDSGAPQRLLWRGQRFLVSSRPIPWVDRTSWWKEGPRAPLGATESLEHHMWQVQVRSVENSEMFLLDIQASATQQWQVTAVHA